MNFVNVLNLILISFGTLCKSFPANLLNNDSKSLEANTDEDNGSWSSTFILIFIIAIIFVIVVVIFRRSKKSIPKNNNYFPLEPRNTSADEEDSILHRGLLNEDEEETAPLDDNVIRSNITRYKDDDENLSRDVEVYDANDNQSVTSFVDTPVTFPEEQQRQNIFSIMDEEEDDEENT